MQHTEQHKEFTKAERRQIFRRLAKHALFAKKTLIIGFVFTILMIVIDLIGPYIISLMLDTEFVNGVGVKNPNRFTWLVAIFAITSIVSAMMRYISSYTFQKASNEICLKMQKNVFNHLERLPIAYFDKLPAGSVVSRITNDTRAVRILYQVALIQVLMSAVYSVGIMVALLAMNWFYFCIILVALPIVLYFGAKYRRLNGKYMRRLRRNVSMINASMNETVQGMDVIRTTNKEDLIYEDFSKINDDAYENGFQMVRIFAKYPVTTFVGISWTSMALAVSYFLFTNFYHVWAVPVGTVFLFVNYNQRLFQQITHATMRLGDIERAYAAADHVFELLAEPTIREGGLAVPEIVGTVKFDNVTFAYKEEKVLQNINFEIPSGKTYAFVGHTGSGKSTIMNLLFGFYEPQVGEITIDGIKLSEADLVQMRKHMAIVMQDPFLFKGTIFSNVTMDDPSYTDADVRQAMLDVGGEHLLERLAEGVHAPVTEKGSDYSAGERQIISFARAMIKNPRILVLDEATSNIDSETERVISHGISRMAKDRTTVIIAHRLSTIKNADKIFVLRKSKIAEVGTHEELIAKEGIYYAMYQAQSDV